MLAMSTCTARFGTLGFSEVLMRFLTDDELVQLERLAAKPRGNSGDLKRAGQIIWAARTRAEMRHPGVE